MADFSIVTVTYNSEKTLRKAMDSVINQTMPPTEYIIVDGMSKDGTVKVAESFRELCNKKGINLIIISEKDDGIYDAMNKGIKLAKGEIIGMINSDDYYEPDAISKVNRVYETKGFDVFYADLYMHLKGDKSFIKKARLRNYMTSRDWNHPTTFITKKIYNNYQYKNENIHDDYDLILRLKKAGVRFEILNEPLAHFTMDGVSHKGKLKDALERVKIKYKIYKDNGYSAFYIVECLGVEILKLLVNK